MQILRVCANRILDGNAFIEEVDWYDAGVLKIMDNGERVLSIYGQPGIAYYILDEGQKLPVIR